MKVLKFGGTSVGTVESIKEVIDIIGSSMPTAVVFSAFGGVTNRIIEIGNLASIGDDNYSDHLHSVEERHFNAIRNLIPVGKQSAVIAQTKGLFNEIEDLLRGISLLKELSPRTMDFLMGFGERLSTYIISEALLNEGINAEFIDARTLIKTDSNFGSATVDFETTNQLIKNKILKSDSIKCVTGFIASDKNNVTTTLGRGGSDYTASIIGAAVSADLIEIWTDVNGMMTADPRKVKNAYTINKISYGEAMELSHFGAKVIYPPSLIPAFAKKIPVKVLNTFNKTHEGTTIGIEPSERTKSITGISSIEDISLINVQGNGMIGVAGVSAKLFSLLAENTISVILISQASSEHSICFAIDPKETEKVKAILNEGFKLELTNGELDKISIQENLSIIAIVGEGMKASSGTSGKLFSILGKNGINVIAIAQGSSELNISVVIPKKDISKSLNAIHETFFQTDGLSMNLFILGPTGLIGTTLLNQMTSQVEVLRKENRLKLNLIGIANTKKMKIDASGIPIKDWKKTLLEKGDAVRISEFIEDIQDLNLPNSVFVDCTANKDITQYYGPLLKANVSIVTPNKVANSESYQNYVDLQSIIKKGNVKFLYETTVGAGLPIINTLKGLINSGDKIEKIEAVLSGTLSYIFNNYQVGTSFLDIVKEAKEKGFTEPDPREDLSGADVARKILILAREAGYALEPKDVGINLLLNEACTNASSIEGFYTELEKDNNRFEKMLLEAEAIDHKLRFIAVLENGVASIGIKSVGPDHPFYSLAGSENIVSFTTNRYKQNPLVVKGPGAGAEVTAMGAFADIISLGEFFS